MRKCKPDQLFNRDHADTCSGRADRHGAALTQQQDPIIGQLLKRGLHIPRHLQRLSGHRPAVSTFFQHLLPIFFARPCSKHHLVRSICSTSYDFHKDILPARPRGHWCHSDWWCLQLPESCLGLLFLEWGIVVSVFRGGILGSQEEQKG